MEIEYKLGSSNKVADALSRRDEVQINAMLISYLADWDELQKEILTDPRLQEIREKLKKGEALKQPYVLVGEKLFHKGRICISANSTWIPRIIEEFHATPVGGHSGAWRTYKRVAANFYLPGMF